MYNSEAWSDITEKDIGDIEKIDEYLLRSLLKGHSKGPLEMLHLETGTLPVKYIISSRRLLYHHNIISRNESELIHRVYSAQKMNPIKQDWYKLLQNDFDLIGGRIDDAKIKSMKKYKYKKHIKKEIRKAAFDFLQEKKNGHSKVQDIVFDKLRPQNYIKSDKFSNDNVSLLFRLRSRTTNVKCNFKTQFKGNLKCSSGCLEEETQQHILQCKPLLDKIEENQEVATVVYEDIFDENKQLDAVILYSKLF